MRRAKWIWMPHAAHFIYAKNCRFHLATYIGKYIVSTVGEYVPGGAAREILAESRGIVLEGMGDAREYDYMKKIGFEDIGAGRKYETYVFKAKENKDKSCGCDYVPSSWGEIDSSGYNDGREAYQGHLKMCEKWSSK